MAPGSLRTTTAEEEFKKNPELTREDLVELRQWLKTQKHLPEITDKMLIQFHHSCYFEMTNTRKCIETYCTMRSNTPEIFSNRDITSLPLSEHKSSISTFILPDTINGTRIIYYSLREFEPSKYHMYDHMKIFFMLIDACVAQRGTESDGAVIVFNMKNIRLGHLTRLNLFGFKKFFQYVEEAIPIRLKKIHLINVMPFIDKFMALLRPFINKKFYNLMHFHTTDMDAFYEAIPRKYLPKEAGGSLESEDVFNAETFKLFTEFVDFFAEEEILRVNNENKRDKRKNSKHKNSDVDIPSFGSLEID